MKELLTEILDALQTGLAASGVRSTDIFITPHVQYVPDRVKKPCIGVKDSSIRRVELAGEMMEYVMRVEIAVFVSLLKEAASVMGDDAASAIGVLDLADAVHEILDENLLDIDGMEHAYSPEESGSELFGDERNMIVRKVLIYEYTKTAERP